MAYGSCMLQHIRFINPSIAHDFAILWSHNRVPKTKFASLGYNGSHLKRTHLSDFRTLQKTWKLQLHTLLGNDYHFHRNQYTLYIQLSKPAPCNLSLSLTKRGLLKLVYDSMLYYSNNFLSFSSLWPNALSIFDSVTST